METVNLLFYGGVFLWGFFFVSFLGRTPGLLLKIMQILCQYYFFLLSPFAFLK